MGSIESKSRPIYLHFLDRELKRAEKVDYNDKEILIATIIAVFGTLNYCYCSASILFESQNAFPISTNLIFELEKVDIVKLLTNEHSFEEFITSRQEIYAHNSSRYPMYFKKEQNLNWPNKPLLVAGSSTKELRTNLLGWINNSNSNLDIYKESFNKVELESFNISLITQPEKAITLDLFLNPEQQSIDKIRRNTGRLISYFYTKRYLDLYNGDIVNSLPNLTFYDTLSTNRILNNSNLISTILNRFEIINNFFGEDGFNIAFFIQFVTHSIFKQIQIELAILLYSLVETCKADFNSDPNLIFLYWNKNVDHTKITNDNNIENYLFSIYISLKNASLKLSGVNQSFKNAYQMSKETLTTNKKVLIVVATELEAKALFKVMGSKGLVAKPLTIGKMVYWNFGIINNSDIMMVRSGMGSSDVSGSTLTISDAIRDLDPDYIIMVGIAFGLNEKKQKIGDILVSRHLENYDHSKIKGDKTIHRSSKIPASVTLIGRFENAIYNFSGANIDFGLIISGDKLVDSHDFINNLKIDYPEAIGGEMEGAGLFATCHRESKEWILIKGICDWGYNKQSEHKDEDQKVAIINVCEYLYHTLTTFSM